MNQQQIIKLLEEVIDAKSIRVDERMSKHTTFRIGGPADVFVTPQTEEELIATIKLCHQAQIPKWIIGHGSNLLVDDAGFRGVVIQIDKNLSDLVVEGTTITAYAGTMLARLANTALEEELTGLEFAHGIPGTLGGAVTMNAGAYGGEMADVLVKATVITPDGQCIELTKEALELGYRTSIIEKKGYIVLKATMQLQKGNREAIQSQMKDFIERRKDKQPLEYPSAGSTFKRPEGYFAGKLIMDSGLRGYAIGGAKVSDKHCGFIINTGDATCKDVRDLIDYVKKEVAAKYSVTLETEVKYLRTQND